MGDFLKITICVFVVLFIEEGMSMYARPPQQQPPQQPPPQQPPPQQPQQQPPLQPSAPAQPPVNLIAGVGSAKQFPINLSNNLPAAAPQAPPIAYYPRVQAPPAAYDLTNQIQGARRNLIYAPPRYMAPRRRTPPSFFDTFAPYFFMESFDII